MQLSLFKMRRGKFDHYDVVYLWHEVLHSYLPTTDIAHCLIQFMTDNGLRQLLNPKEEEFPLVGHPYLNPLMEKIYPYWKEYLKRPKRDIFQFLEELEGHRWE